MFSFYKLVEEYDKKKLVKEDLSDYGGVIQVIVKTLVILLITVLSFFIGSHISPSLTKSIQAATGESKWKVRVFEISTPNAFALAIGFNSLFITRGLVKMLTEREITAVLLHEVSHSRSLDSLQSLGGKVGLPVLLMTVGIRSRNEVLTMLGAVCMLFLPVFLNITLGRYLEKKSDIYTTKFGYGNDLVSALRKLEDYIKKKEAKEKCGRICGFIKRLSRSFDEHPETEERIKEILHNQKVQDALNRKSIPAMKTALLSFVGGGK